MYKLKIIVKECEWIDLRTGERDEFLFYGGSYDGAWNQIADGTEESGLPAVAETPGLDEDAEGKWARVGDGDIATYGTQILGCEFSFCAGRQWWMPTDFDREIAAA